jgi:hypothetical protein
MALSLCAACSVYIRDCEYLLQNGNQFRGGAHLEKKEFYFADNFVCASMGLNRGQKELIKFYVHAQ